MLEYLARFVESRYFPQTLMVLVTALCVTVAITSNAEQFSYFVLGMLACMGVVAAVTVNKRRERGK